MKVRAVVTFAKPSFATLFIHDGTAGIFVEQTPGNDDATVWTIVLRPDISFHNGEPLNAEVIDQVQRAWGQTIRDGFGQTESTVQVANTPGQPVTSGLAVKRGSSVASGTSIMSDRPSA